MKAPKTEIVEKHILIANRVPKGDRWRLVSDEPNGRIHLSIVDTLEAYMSKTNFKGHYRLDLDYDLSDLANTQVNVSLIFFDIKDIGTNIGVFHKDVALTQIIARGELVINGKVKRKTIQKGQSKTISTSTLIVADDGTFNQQTASIALKKVCEAIINDLLKKK